MVFDLSNRKSFEDAKGWVSDLRQRDKEVEIVVAGNKSDLEIAGDSARCDEAEIL